MKDTVKPSRKPRVLLELRPAFDGYAGIPQETRLLFRGLRLLETVEVSGMLQMSHRILAKGTVPGSLFFGEQSLSEARKINRYSRVVISAAERPFTTLFDRVLDLFERRLLSVTLTFQTIFGLKKVTLSTLRTRYFEDFVWRALFAKTLPAADYGLVTAAEQRVCSTPWNLMHMVGLHTLNLFRFPRYAKLSTRGIDIFIAQTPYPARLDRRTAFVVRYHDALPVLMPHTISDKSLHQATHFYALSSNVRSGAYFACVSHSTRSDLLRMFPEVAERAVTIHNMVSHHYYPEESPSQRVPGIIRSRLYGLDPDAKDLGLAPTFFTLREQERFYAKALSAAPLNYLLSVSTVEPRKNHARMIAAWEVLKAEVDPTLKIVIVGTLGWDYQQLLKSFRAWIDRGELFMLNAVPAPDLRVLYQHATATVCPSVGEGFDFSGVEAMRSGGVVVASDIAVHREVYSDAAVYFNPYSTGSLVEALKCVLYSPDSLEVQKRLRICGQEVAKRYLPENILPQWESFLSRVFTGHEAGVRDVVSQQQVLLEPVGTVEES
jgi:glycosyltransferase involved in cell wall biosynthesis